MITLAIVDDHRYLLPASAAHLDSYPDLRVVATGSTVAEVQAAVAEPPTVVVLDVWLAEDPEDPRPTFAANLARLREWGTRVVVATNDMVTSGFRVTAFHAGVVAIVAKQSDQDELLAAIRHAPTGGQLLTPDWNSHLESYGGRLPVALSPQETRVMRLFAVQMTHEEIATALGLSKTTVKWHIENVKAKYAAADRPTATRAELGREIRRDGHLPGGS